MSVISRRRERERASRRGYYRRERRGYYRREHASRGWWGARRVAGSGAIDALARFGLVARGIIYIVIGAIAVMLAFGAARHVPDRAGALAAVASKPFGYVLLWIITLGLAGLALWKIVQAAVARLNPTEGHRLRAAGCAVGYVIAFVTTYWFVRDGRVPASSDTVSRDLTATVMSYNGGQLIVAIAGVVIIVTGIYLAVQAFRLDFTRYLRMGWMSRRTQDTVVQLGRAWRRRAGHHRVPRRAGRPGRGGQLRPGPGRGSRRGPAHGGRPAIRAHPAYSGGPGAGGVRPAVVLGSEVAAHLRRRPGVTVGPRY